MKMIEMIEIWKDIKDYEGIYQVSNLGRVKSLPRKHNLNYKIRKLVPDKDGYSTVVLYNNGSKCKNMKVHRLVAQAFIPNPNDYPQVNHIDEVKSNNHVDNLEWCSVKYNMTYGNHIDRLENMRVKVLKLNNEGVVLKVYNKMIDVIEDGFVQSCVSRCCNGERKHHKGFIWRYADD